MVNSFRSHAKLSGCIALLFATLLGCQSSGDAPPPTTPAGAEGGANAGQADAAGPAEPQANPAATPQAGAVPAASDAAAPAPGGGAPTAGGNAAAPAPGQPAAATVRCQHLDTLRQVGETWAHECNTCKCQPDGMVACTLKHCGDAKNPVAPLPPPTPKP